MDDLTIREGTIQAVEADRLIVRIEREDAAECGGCCRCPMRGLCRGRDSGHMELPVPFTSDNPHRIGDRVHVAYRKANAAVAAAILFVPALAGLFLGGFLANRLWGEGDGVFLAGCAIGFVLGLAVTFVVNRFFPSLKPSVRLVEDAIPSQ